ncbi:thioredoxin family protein [Salinicoccus albus]|uniref:thioredoxin family protein n=1 Tax=Salinicoccus albus TaxID=418756 RepID=UPI00036872AD|nr:thioredoxin family protein [Salinicoccus albus]
MTELDQWFDKAMSAEQYINDMEAHRENLQKVCDNFELPEDEDFFSHLKRKNLRAIVITEDWCGDAMVNTPVLLHLAEKSDMEVRMILRDSNLELMDQYLTNGKSRSIPIIIFIDAYGAEVTHWGPRSEENQRQVDALMAGLPDKEADNYKEKFREKIGELTKRFTTEEEMWQSAYQSMKAKLEANI